ncbi:hypothetical protein ATANTOWER_010168, partial [Ataeniobius toweri]|nr:hypothetical protein [Ataeniobius toweri]
IVTVNCARLIKPDQHATNGIVHVIDRVITAVSNNMQSIIDIDDDLETLRVSKLISQLDEPSDLNVLLVSNQNYAVILTVAQVGGVRPVTRGLPVQTPALLRRCVLGKDIILR